MLTPESFAVCFICLVMLVFFLGENRHEETMKRLKTKERAEMQKLNFIVLHQLEGDKEIAILVDSITSFGEKDETHACTVYFDGTSVTVSESYERIANLIKNYALTNMDWAEQKSKFSFSFGH